jgi:hypothetical protein
MTPADLIFARRLILDGRPPDIDAAAQSLGSAIGREASSGPLGGTYSVTCGLGIAALEALEQGKPGLASSILSLAEDLEN